MIKKILVCVKLVPSAQTVEMDGQFRLKRDSTTLQLNIADTSALEAALRMKYELIDAQVVVISMGPIATEKNLLELYALGVDRVVLLSDRVFAGADSLATAKTLAYAAKRLGGFDCIICGRRAIDAETGQIPGQLAAALKIPVITNIQQLHTEGSTILCERRLENGIVQLEVNAPCVLSVCEYTYKLRLPSIMGKRYARGKQVEIFSADYIGLSEKECGVKYSKTKVVGVNTKTFGLRRCNYCDIGFLAKKIREVLP